ncbi:phage regulatory CII family protein [Duganella sp.]|uniref:phage regulatory CII family protein n=1 Tax=Duganella sp. TaxID=1904440 RepID=UPI0031E36190
MNAKDAFHQTVHNYPGGCEALAARLGVNAAVLRNKANPNADYHKPTLDDVDRVMVLTGDVSVLHALAANVGHVCVRAETDGAVSDMAVLELVAKAWSASSDVGAEVYATLADGIVEAHEVRRVEQAVYRTVQALNEMVTRLKSMAEK